MRNRNTSTRSLVAVSVSSLIMGFGLARCGADNVDAPVPPPDSAASPQCKSLEQSMPEFFKLLRDPSQPLDGIREVVTALVAGRMGQPQGNSIAPLLSDTLHGLGNFAKDPKENGGACVTVTAAVAPPTAPLCTVTPAAPCESRICALRRALDFGLRDAAGTKALDAFVPLLAKLVGYLSNKGPGADGQEHYQVIDVFNRTSRNEARCSPANLLDVLDGVVVYFRPSRACGANCIGLQALQDVQDLIEDPAMQSFLQDYANSEGSGKGRSSFQALGQLLGQAFSNLPEDATYFDAIQKIVDTMVQFFDSYADHRYDALKTKVQAVVAVAKDLLNPQRPGSFSHQLKSVAACVTIVDNTQEVVGALYDLLSRPGGVNGNGVDLKEFVVVLNTVAKLDQDGVLSGAIHAVLASIRADDESMRIVRQFLVDFITVDNAHKLLPPVQTMITKGVIKEALTFLDTLVYGCQIPGQQ